MLLPNSHSNKALREGKDHDFLFPKLTMSFNSSAPYFFGGIWFATKHNLLFSSMIVRPSMDETNVLPAATSILGVLEVVQAFLQRCQPQSHVVRFAIRLTCSVMASQTLDLFLFCQT